MTGEEELELELHLSEADADDFVITALPHLKMYQRSA